MSSSIQLQAIVEAPNYEDEFLCPWEVAEFEPLSRIRLSAKITYPEIGLVFAQLAKCNKIKLENDKQTILKQILADDCLVLPGGIQVVQKRDIISPGCCCGLETWREWMYFLKTGQSPWLGHDPSPWLERRGDIIRIWSDGGIEPSSNAIYIDISYSQFKQALTLLEQDLQAFLFCIESWAQEIGFTESNKLSYKFDKCFDIGRRYTAL